MQTFIITEYSAETIESTGYTALHIAASYSDAVKQVLYTAKIKNGNAFIGPTKRVIHTGFGTCLVVNKMRR